jgi:TolB protein
MNEEQKSQVTPTMSATPRPPLNGSGGGVIAYDQAYDLYVMNADGSDVRRLTNSPIRYINPSWSPDGAYIVFNTEYDNRDIYVMDVQQALRGADDSVQRLTYSPADDYDPVWSPDGAHIAFTSNRDGNYDIYLMDVQATLQGSDGAVMQRLTYDAGDDESPDWSPDGAQIAFVSKRDGSREIYLMDVQHALQGSGDANLRRLTDNDAGDYAPAWSPDGAQIVFQSGRDHSLEIYVMNSDGSDPRRLTYDDANDLVPDWSPDGTRITYNKHNTDDDTAGLYIMNADGTNPQWLQITRGSYTHAWRPVAPAEMPEPAAAIAQEGDYLGQYQPMKKVLHDLE